MNRIYKLLFIALLAFGKVYAQEPSLTATLSESNVAVGDQFEISFSLNTNGRNFQTPAFSDFQVLSGPNQSTSMQFVNGQMTQSVVFSFILLAKKEDTFKIGPAIVDVGGKKMQSNIVTIKVAKAGTQAKRAADGAQDASVQLGNNLMIKVSLNKSSAYQGEAIIATYKLYYKVSIVGINNIEPPNINGFWSQDIEMPKNLVGHKEILNGIQYDVAEVKKTILFPQQNGTLEIGSMKMECIARIQAKRKQQRSNDPFAAFFNDPFFGGGVQDVNVKIKSEPVKINVKALANAPEGFSGAVGDFKMEAFIDKPQGKTNDPITLKVKITGKGNIKLIDAPKPVLPPDIESYDPKTSDAVTASASGLSGTRTFEYLLIPRHKGQYKIEPIKFSYFDVDKKQFVTQTSNEFKLNIAQGNDTESSTTNSSAGVNKEDVTLLGKDIRYIKTGNIDLKPTGSIFFGSGLYYTLLILPVLLFIAFMVYFQNNKKLSGNVALMKSKKATKLAQKRLEIAKKHLSKESANVELRKQNVNETLREKFLSTINKCEFARFAPGGTGEMQEMYDNTIALITNIEESIK
jgi:hypothetical protein